MREKSFGVYIRRLRKDRYWSQKHLAARMDTSDSTISRIEHGQDVPVSDLPKLAQAFGMDQLTLLRGFFGEEHSGAFRLPTRLNMLLQQAFEAGMDLPESERKDLAFLLAIALREQLPPERVTLYTQLREVAGVSSS